MNIFTTNIAVKIGAVKGGMSESATPRRGRGRPRAVPDEALRERLRIAMGDRSKNSVAKAAGISEGLLRGYLSAGMQPGGDKLVRLASVLGVSLEWLATGKGQPPPRSPAETAFVSKDLALVPVYPIQLGAGTPRLHSVPVVEPETHFPIPAQAVRQLAPQPSALVGLRVAGNSMEPTIPDGWIAIVDTTRTMIRPKGGIYAVRLDDELWVKHVRWDGDSLVLSSENPDYPPMVLAPPDAERVEVLGFVTSWHQPVAPGATQD